MNEREMSHAISIKNNIIKDIEEMENVLVKLKTAVNSDDVSIDSKLCRYHEAISKLGAADSSILREYTEMKTIYRR